MSTGSWTMYYVVRKEGQVYVARWDRGAVVLVPDSRSVDEIMLSAESKGHGTRYEGVGFGPRTTAAIVEHLGWDWESLATIRVAR